MNDKIICIVPHCTRGMLKSTARKRWGNDRISLICGKHWMRLTKAERAVWARIKRLERRSGGYFSDRSHRIWSALARRSAS